MWKIMKRLYWKGKEGLRKYCRDKEETILLCTQVSDLDFMPLERML